MSFVVPEGPLRGGYSDSQPDAPDAGADHHEDPQKDEDPQKAA